MKVSARWQSAAARQSSFHPVKSAGNLPAARAIKYIAVSARQIRAAGIFCHEVDTKAGRMDTAPAQRGQPVMRREFGQYPPRQVDILEEQTEAMQEAPLVV